MIVRAPAVAGSFYELQTERLRKQIEACFKHELGPKGFDRKSVIAAVVPHAGYAYSGPIAAWTYSRLPPANFVIIGPNHHGVGAECAVLRDGLWKTPLNGVSVDPKLAEELLQHPLIQVDVLAHEAEHSIEVQLPFLQYCFGNEFKFIPLCVKNEFPDRELLKHCQALGRHLASVLKRQKERWIILASTDLTHYEPQEIASSIDERVLAAVLRLDESKFFAKLNELNASWCGFGPIAIAMVAAKHLGAKRCVLLKYATSGDITGEYEAVVGYASLLLL